jgi:hypothetical protein
MARQMMEIHLQRCPEMPNRDDFDVRSVLSTGWLSKDVGFQMHWTPDKCRVFRTGNGGETWEEQS